MTSTPAAEERLRFLEAARSMLVIGILENCGFSPVGEPGEHSFWSFRLVKD
jgi:hypothetical protein